jgi:catechol 2,3-dioxygenase-like lactoylglutathione lyase family enzyme
VLGGNLCFVDIGADIQLVLLEAKMNNSLGFIALAVPDLRAAEDYYQSVFNMELIGREAELADGLWYTLPFDKGWDEAEAAGIKLGMLALRKDGFVLALFRGDAPPGQVFVIGIQMPMEEIVRVRARLQKEAQVREGAPDRLEFRDPYHIISQISLPGIEFRIAGDFANRWLKL